MIIKQYIEPLENSSTNAFIGIDELGNKYVVKAMIGSNNGKILMNEYLTGKLAEEIQLPWPKTNSAILGCRVIEFLNKKSLIPRANECVANDFKKIEKIFDDNTRCEKINFEYLKNLFNNNYKCISSIYGRAIFEVWLNIEDYKQDTIKINKIDNSPIFIDGSHSFGGDNWSNFDCILKNYRMYEKNQALLGIDLFNFQYLSGISKYKENFVEWIERIKQIPDTNIEKIINNIPDSWDINDLRKDSLKIFLSKSYREIFIQNYETMLD